MKALPYTAANYQFCSGHYYNLQQEKHEWIFEKAIESE